MAELPEEHTLDRDEAPAGPSAVPTMNWSNCLLCQQITDEHLQCPARSKRKDRGAGYITLAEDLQLFAEINELHTGFNLAALDDGSGIAQTLLEHEAHWHKSCRDMYNKTKLNRAFKRKIVDNEPGSASHGISKSTRSTYNAQNTHLQEAACFFCDQVSPLGNLTQACTFGLDARVRSLALQLEDSKLLAKLSAGDMIAIEAKYHKKCLVALYNRGRHKVNKDAAEDNDEMIHSIALAQLIVFIEDTRSNESGTPVFKLSELAKDYCLRLEQLGLEQGKKIHTGRLKDKLLAHIPHLRAYPKGRDVMMGFDDDVALLLSNVCQQNKDAHAICLAQAAKVVREELFAENTPFNGTFSTDCQAKSVPPSLLAMVNMILQGPNIKDQAAKPTNQAALTIAQLLKFNSVKHKRHGTSTTKHSRNLETPLPIYIGTMLHAKTRKRQLVDCFFDLGLSVSYDRVLRISAGLGNAVCERFRDTQVVCPPQLLGNVFTTAAIDNIDHNPSSTTAAGSFHGTGISLIQHPNSAGEGRDMGQIVIEDSSTKCISNLPESYSCVPPVSIKTVESVVPAVVTGMQCDPDEITAAIQKEEHWLERVRTTDGSHAPREEDSEENSNKKLAISWSAYHAECQITDIKPQCTSMLLPLFPDAAHSVAMIHHSMTVVKKAVQYLNPGQTPVLIFDQPLFALAKEIQWSCPDSVGEDKMVIVLGGLHTEMAVLRAVGSWLDGSGWVDVLVQADVTTSGKADSLLKAAHVTRTRYAHQVTAASLHQLQHSAYEKYMEIFSDDEPMSFSAWCGKRITESPQFQFWSLTLEFELLIMILVRSFRESNFSLYTSVLCELVPWLFALDRTHYSRWLPIHIRDMLELQHKHPDIHQEFMNGNFTVQKTANSFSAIAIDQAHEQNNELVKGDGGAIGLTENASALLRWMVAGPEVARMIKEFEETINAEKWEGSHHHHEQSPARQERFRNDVKSLCATIDELGNPFEEEGDDLISLSTKDIADQSVCNTVRQIKAVGLEQYQHFVRDRLVERSKPLNDKIPLNKLPLFPDRPSKHVSKSKVKLLSAKNDSKLFSKLYIGCQNRDGNLDDFFAHENQGCPPSLSDGGKLRSGRKSDLVECLDKLVEVHEGHPTASALIMDAAAVIQMLKPTACKTFLEYSENIFLPYISTWLEKVNRIDIVWDDYFATSLKAATRAKRGSGTRRRILPSVSIPKNWQSFLRLDSNKKELFKFLSEEASKIQTEGKMVVATYGPKVLMFPPQENNSMLSPCSHEEADTRIMVHVVDAVAKGHQSIIIRTVDTDVVVLAVNVAHRCAVKELWIAYGTGKNYKLLPAHAYASALGADRCKSLPMFHAITGCDTTSYFCGRGKNTAWATWQCFPTATNAFLELAHCPSDVSAECLATLERFVTLMYDRTSDREKVNDVRKHLCTKKGRAIEGLPPTQAALIQHIRRACYQGGYIWGQTTVPMPVLPDATAWGWMLVKGELQPKWTTLSEASKACYELVHCGCKTNCTSRCKCVKAALSCTPLCMCDGMCTRD